MLVLEDRMKPPCRICKTAAVTTKHGKLCDGCRKAQRAANHENAVRAYWPSAQLKGTR